MAKITQWTTKQEIGRKFIHLLGGLALILGYIFILELGGKNTALMGLTLVLLVFIALDFLRLELRIKIPFSQYLRPKEEHVMMAATGLLAAAVICFAVFNFKIALASMLMIIVGEFAASVIRIKYKKIEIQKLQDRVKKAEIVEFIINILICYFLLQNWLIALPMAAVATSIEITSFKINDNLAVPLVAGFIGQLLICFL